MNEPLDRATILVIDDDITFCEGMKLIFAQANAHVQFAHTGRAGIEAFFKSCPDLTFLNVRMPDIDGWETLRQIRLESNNPVILLSTLASNEAVVRGLDSGADDFIVKPFNKHVLLSRTRAVLRRVRFVYKDDKPGAYNDGYLVIDLNARQVFVAGQLVRLTAMEFRLLAYLLQNPERVLTYQQILEHVWGQEYQDSIDYVHVYLSHLRRKLEKDVRNPRYLLNEHGVGYRFERRQLSHHPN